MKVKKYNVKGLIEKTHKTITTYTESDVVIIEGTKGIIVTDNEAIHNLYDDFNGIYEFDVCAIGGNTPIGLVKISIDEMITADSTEVELTEYVRKFGSRIENNYALLLKTIKEIGLNPKDYPRV
jgi:hypothetical protein